MSKNLHEFHPAANLIYFILGFAAVFTADNIIFYLPVIAVLVTLNIMLDRAKALRSNLVFFIIIAGAVFVLNPLFSHRGAVILFYLFGNPVTLESVISGAQLALSLLCMFMLFAVFNLVINQDKFLYLFSRLAKQTAFVIMLALKFVPLLRHRITEISQISRSRRSNGSRGLRNIRERLQNGMKIILTLISWSLEDAIITAQSMRARGYGVELPKKRKRTFYFVYKFTIRDFMFIIFNILSFAAFLTFGNIIFFLCVFALPLIAEGLDYIKWSLYDIRNRV